MLWPSGMRTDSLGLCLIKDCVLCVWRFPLGSLIFNCAKGFDGRAFHASQWNQQHDLAGADLKDATASNTTEFPNGKARSCG